MYIGTPGARGLPKDHVLFPVAHLSMLFLYFVV